MERLLRRLNHTWQKVHRDRHLAALYFQLSDPEYRLCDFYSAACVWDKKYVETYGTVEFTDRDVANILSWSPAKVCRTRKNLIERRIIRLNESGAYVVIPPPTLPKSLETLKEKVAWMQGLVSPTQHDVALPKQVVAPVQQTQGYSADSSIVPYKNKNSFFYPKTALNKQKVRKENEYQRMYQNDPDRKTPVDTRGVIMKRDLPTDGKAQYLAELLNDTESLKYYEALVKEHDPELLIKQAHRVQEMDLQGKLHTHNRKAYFQGILRNKGMKTKFNKAT